MDLEVSPLFHLSPVTRHCEQGFQISLIELPFGSLLFRKAKQSSIVTVTNSPLLAILIHRCKHRSACSGGGGSHETATGDTGRASLGVLQRVASAPTSSSSLKSARRRYSLAGPVEDLHQSTLFSTAAFLCVSLRRRSSVARICDHRRREEIAEFSLALHCLVHSDLKLGPWEVLAVRPDSGSCPLANADRLRSYRRIALS